MLIIDNTMLYTLYCFVTMLYYIHVLYYNNTPQVVHNTMLYTLYCFVIMLYYIHVLYYIIADHYFTRMIGIRCTCNYANLIIKYMYMYKHLGCI